ncbi:hypothetical protein Tco_1092702 [Tanacetum coccineum]|uniref:Uncharacterized protein n=1 Tax=Tanacetum coccineum TaxID=301880 RepID=A0ABQ5IBW4_9ASTR
MMSTPVFVDPKSSTQADGAQSSRVPVPLPEDPYEAIRQAYLDGTNTESEPFEDPINTETPESPLAIAPPIPLSEKVAAMSESAFRKMFRSSYESSPSVSPPDHPSQKCYYVTSELVEDSEEDDDEEDEEIEESMDYDSVEDEDPAAEDEGLTARVEGLGMDDEGYGLDDESRGIDGEGHSVESDGPSLEEEEAVPGGQQQAASVVGTIVSAPLGLGYGALRCRELALEEGDVYNTFEVRQGSGSAPESERPERVSAFRQPTLTTWTDLEVGMIYIDIPDYPPPAPPVQTPPSLEWTSGLLPISPSPSDDPSPISSPMIPLTGGLISDHAVRLEELSPALFESLEYEQERVSVTFEAIWRLVLALEAWERRARLELAEVVDGIRRGQKPRGGEGSINFNNANEMCSCLIALFLSNNAPFVALGFSLLCATLTVSQPLVSEWQWLKGDSDHSALSCDSEEEWMVNEKNDVDEASSVSVDERNRFPSQEDSNSLRYMVQHFDYSVFSKKRIFKKKAKNDQTKHGVEKTKSIRSQRSLNMVGDAIHFSTKNPCEPSELETSDNHNVAKELNADFIEENISTHISTLNNVAF